MSKKGQDFSMAAGETKRLNFEVTDMEDIKGFEIWWVFAESERSRNNPILKKTNDTGGGITIGDEGDLEVADNVFTVKLEPDDTINLVPGSIARSSRTYYHEAWIKDIFGEVRKVAIGEMTVSSTVQPERVEV